MPLVPPPQQDFECPICHGWGTIIVKDENDDGDFRELCPNMSCRSGRVADDHRDGMD